MNQHLEEARAWLSRARSNYILGSSDKLAGVLIDDYCNQLQQACEKSVKAVYIAFGFEFEWTHDLGRLLSGLKSKGIDIPAEIEQSVDLTVYAVSRRYQVSYEDTTESEIEAFKMITSGVLDWCKNMVDKSGEGDE
jgi:HEPN domain-containing protein